MTQTMAEENAVICLISEPATIPDSPRWFASSNGLAAIYVGDSPTSRGLVSLYKRGKRCVAVRMRSIILIACYVSPNVGLNEFRALLNELLDIVSSARDRGIILAGDFNARAVHWGCADTTRRGELLEAWAAGLDLRLANIGNIPTCVRWQGTSVVDLTWVSASLIGRISDWKVRNDLESLSDHRYVSFLLSDRDFSPRGGFLGPKWNMRKLDVEILRDSIEWSCAVGPVNAVGGSDPGLWIDRVLREACDASAPRIFARGSRRHVYWWCDEVESQRRLTIRARRNYSKARSRGDADATDSAHQIYKRNKAVLKREIARAKERAWADLLALIDEDPWGTPYRVIVKRLTGGVNLTETLERDVLDRLLDSLFPDGERPAAMDWERRGLRWLDEWTVTPEEVRLAIKEKKKVNTAPGPDGVSAVILKRLPPSMIGRLADCFTACLRMGCFPVAWKTSRLVLIPKAGPATCASDVIPKARPICLLSEVGKTLERVIALRLERFMSENSVANLGAGQFGFRRGRSTCDALVTVKRHIQAAMRDNLVVLAVGLDIANAFNSLPWSSVDRALRWRKHFPLYLCRVINAYLADRWIEFMDIDGRVRKREVGAGVPQGSVLGPLLWNLAFDAVVRSQKLPGCEIVCYADDTLLLVTAPDTYYACETANKQIRRLLRLIGELGLKISEAKTEATLFSRRGLIGDPRIRVGNTEIIVKNKMKYLGVIIDSRLSFLPHVEHVVAKASTMQRTLGLLMPNLRGPSQARRRLYYNVVMSIMLYGVPVWGEEVLASSHKQRPLKRVQRLAAIGVVCAYRTVSLDAALLLAGVPPLPLVIRARGNIFRRVDEIKKGENPTEREIREVKNQEYRQMRDDWETYLTRPDLSGRRTLDAVRPHFDAWLDRRCGGLSFRMTQLLTGHGCFGTYLHRIRRSVTMACFHCDARVDSVEHTLMECPAWRLERQELHDRINGDINLTNIVGSIVESGEVWNAFRRFAETVMSIKEEAERRRQLLEAEDGLFVDPVFLMEESGSEG